MDQHYMQELAIELGVEDLLARALRESGLGD